MTSENLVTYIRRNRVSSTEVADCLGKSGALPDVVAVNRGHFRVGPVTWVYGYDESNWPIHEQIEDVPENSIVVVDDLGCGDRALFGDIVAKYLLLYKQATAVVVTGKVRDVHRLIKEDWPIWCTGFSPVGCFNRKPTTEPDPALVAERQGYFHNAIAVCDDTGVVIIPKDQQDSGFMQKMEFIEEQEDIWYECIDRRKWSTYKTICEKAYLSGLPAKSPLSDDAQE
ncbi:MAG: RraA family protein [Planctomycetaceae bacterium]|nr:RraA family protein [Planctomycetaceae bacterium]